MQAFRVDLDDRRRHIEVQDKAVALGPCQDFTLGRDVPHERMEEGRVGLQRQAALLA